MEISSFFFSPLNINMNRSGKCLIYLSLSAKPIFGVACLRCEKEREIRCQQEQSCSFSNNYIICFFFCSSPLCVFCFVLLVCFLLFVYLFICVCFCFCVCLLRLIIKITTTKRNFKLHSYMAKPQYL